jgi:hypothetical protein
MGKYDILNDDAVVKMTSNIVTQAIVWQGLREFSYVIREEYIVGLHIASN